MGLIDTALAGRYSELALAATGLGATVFLAFCSFGIGLLLALDPLCSQACGARNTSEARMYGYQGLYVATWVSLPVMALMVAFAYALEPCGVVPHLAQQTRVYLLARVPSVPAFLWVIALRSFLQAHHEVKAAVVSMVWANVANGVLSAFAMFGDRSLHVLGLPGVGYQGMGVLGGALGSTVATYIQVFPLLRTASAQYALTWRHKPSYERAYSQKIVRLGWPLGMHMVAEVGIFSAVGLLMGRMSTLAMAAHQSALMLASLTFSVCLGLGSATSVQVGRAVGRHNPLEARSCGIAGIFLGLVFMSVTGAIMMLFPTFVAGLITSEAKVLSLAAQLVCVAGVFQFVDGLQTVAGGALRGVGITRWVFVANVLAHWCVGLPVALWLAYVCAWGPLGLWWGLTTGLTVVAIALGWKFWVLERDDFNGA